MYSKFSSELTFQNFVLKGREEFEPLPKTFSKISMLLDLLLKMSLQRSFEKFYKEPRRDQVPKLKVSNIPAL